MKVLIDIPEAFELDYRTDRFRDFFERVTADMDVMCGRYERETAEVLSKAFQESISYDSEENSERRCSMRLIDVDALKERIEENILMIEENTQCRRSGKDRTYGILLGLKSAIESVSQQPTAYDLDKVVEQLENKMQTHKRVIEYEKKNGTITEEFQQRKAVEVLEGAIEIVKGGGVDG